MHFKGQWKRQKYKLIEFCKLCSFTLWVIYDLIEIVKTVVCLLDITCTSDNRRVRGRNI